MKLSRWIDPYSDDTHLWRTAMSGGRATVRNRKGKRTSSQLSDICAQTEQGAPFCKVFAPECKHVRDLNIVAAAVSAKGPLADYWKQVCGVAYEHQRRPLLIAKQNMWPSFAFLCPQDASMFFGCVSSLELCRFLQFPEPEVGMYFFDALLELPYNLERYT